MIANLSPYPNYRSIDVPWLGSVPTHWEVRRLKHVLLRIVGGSTPTSTNPDYWDGDVVWVTPVDVNKETRLKNSLRKITRTGLLSCSSELVPCGSVVITSRAPVGNVALAETTLCTNQGCKTLVLEDGTINSKFAFNVLSILKDELQSLATGTTFTEIATSKLGTVRIPLPPLPEQTAIVAYLDHTDELIRHYVSGKQKLIRLLEEEKQAVIHRAVTRGIDPNVRLKPSGVEWLGDVPVHWEVMSLRRLAISRCDGPFGSGLKSSHYTDQGIRVVRLQNIGHAQFNNADSAFIAPSHYATLGDHTVEPEDLLIAGLGDERHPAGRACVAPSFIVPAMVKADCFRFRLFRQRINPEFAALQLTATAGDASSLLSTGATRQRTNLQATATRPIAVPPIEEQSSIVRYLDKTTSDIDPSATPAARLPSFKNTALA